MHRALRDPNGLLAAGGELTTARLLDAYRRGIFPWYGEGQPVLWWSPDPRMVLAPQAMIISRSLRKRLRRRDWEVRTDTSFAAVMRACAEPRADQAGTWITGEMIDAYSALHRAGYAHSVETWIDGELAGGLYGVSIGRIFFGESMFSRAPSASRSGSGSSPSPTTYATRWRSPGRLSGARTTVSRTPGRRPSHGMLGAARRITPTTAAVMAAWIRQRGANAPLHTLAFDAAFGRNLAVSYAVWNPTGGYPTDPWYRDFYAIEKMWQMPDPQEVH